MDKMDEDKRLSTAKVPEGDVSLKSDDHLNKDQFSKNDQIEFSSKEKLQSFYSNIDQQVNILTDHSNNSKDILQFIGFNKEVSEMINIL